MLLEDFWMNLLSRQPAQVLAAWHDLADEEKLVVGEHLKRMVTEPDWAEPQMISAQMAIDVLKENGITV